MEGKIEVVSLSPKFIMLSMFHHSRNPLWKHWSKQFGDWIKRLSSPCIRKSEKWWVIHFFLPVERAHISELVCWYPECAHIPAVDFSENMPYAIQMRLWRICPHTCMQLQQELSSAPIHESFEIFVSNERKCLFPKLPNSGQCKARGTDVVFFPLTESVIRGIQTSL